MNLVPPLVPLKVRHGVLQTMAEAIEGHLPGLVRHQDQITLHVINLVEDPNE